jgi:predicted transcriptional regulator
MQTMDKKKITPTDSELEILHILWEKGSSTVRQVNERLNDKREVGYTTTLKLMQIMNEKELVVRNTDSRIHVYEASVKENQIKGNLLSEFLQNTFKGSASSLVMQALGNHDTTTEELEAIKELIKKIEEK